MRSLLIFHGPGRGKAWNRQLLAAIKAIVVERKHELNLRKLDSITVGFDLDGMLRSVDALSETSADFTRLRNKNNNRTGTAGCVAGVMRDGRYVSQVFLDATHLVDLVDDPQAESYAPNVVAHELAHVALNSWQTQRPWAYVFPTRQPDWRYEALRYLTLHAWDEYAACRLSARFGDPVAVARNFAGCLRWNMVRLPKLRLYTRKHWQTFGAIKTFLQAGCAAQGPLQSAAYLMGHIDGLGAPMSVGDLCPSAQRSPLAPCWPVLHHELRQVWQRYDPNFNFGILNGLVPVLMEAVRICGGERMLAGM